MSTARHESILSDSSKVALLDFDGTLADTVRAHEQARRQAMEELIDEDTRSQFTDELQAEAHRHGSHPHEIIGWLLQAAGSYDESLLDQIVERKKQLYEQEAYSGLPQIIGSVEYVRFALSYYKDVAIVTTAAKSEVVPFLQVNNIALDDVKIISGQMTNGNRTLYKPHPFLYQKAMELLRIQPDKAFAIEDSPRGVASAVSAAIPSIVGIETTHEHHDLIAAGATESYKSFEDLTRRI